MSARRRNELGVALPSPVAALSLAAVVLAGVAFVATSGSAEDRTPEAARPVTATPTPTSTPTSTAPTPVVEQKKKPEPKKRKPAVRRGEVYVEVYNNSGISGLAGRVATTATQAGWKVVGSDNWYGTIPASTVYYPPKLQRAARALALDLGIRRTVPAIDPMKLDRLTVILTSDHA